MPSGRLPVTQRLQRFISAKLIDNGGGGTERDWRHEEDVRRPRQVTRTRRREDAQSMVEFALLMPAFLLLTISTMDFGRYVYTRGLLNAEVTRAARLLTLDANKGTDCPAQQDVVEKANGIINSVDPHSIAGDTDPSVGGSNGPSTPPAGQGYVYIYPAVAQSVSNCVGAANRPGSSEVVVQTTYSFVPWTPIVSDIVPSLTIYCTSTQTTEY
jgi:Flp pilus assembly protein TadG